MNVPKETLPPNQSCLPEGWIERIFSRLNATYGAKFSDLWASVDAGEMKALWGQKLAAFNPESIKYALESCDERPFPPTLPEFLGLCRDHAKRQGTYAAALPAPEMSPQEAARRLDEIKARQPQEQKPGLDPRGWCNELKKRYLSGEKLFPIQIQMASEAMGEKWSNGTCSPREAAA